MKDYWKNRINSLEEYIRNSSEKTNPDIVSTNAFYSYRHANRLFKSVNGESINTFSNKIRLQLAADYLLYTSKPIADIAIDVDYQSTAAFSKAFKKQYGQSPSDFREKHNVSELFEVEEKPSFRVAYFEREMAVFKIPISPDVTYEEFYSHLKTEFDQLNLNAEKWILIWDEDPKLSKVSESRYTIGVNPKEINTTATPPFQLLNLTGKYAVFEADSLKAFDYKNWAKLAYFILDLEGVKFRKGAYLEWFVEDSLEVLTAFIPYKIAIPIQ